MVNEIGYSKNLKNLVSGGAGFLGSHLIDNLINQIEDSDKTYPVINSSTGELIGEIDRSIVLKSMTSN